MRGESMKPFEFVSALIVGAAAIAGTVSFSYQTFETKDHIQQMREIRDHQLDKMDAKLDRIDSKLDRVLERE